MFDEYIVETTIETDGYIKHIYRFDNNLGIILFFRNDKECLDGVMYEFDIYTAAIIVFDYDGVHPYNIIGKENYLYSFDNLTETLTFIDKIKACDSIAQLSSIA
jgi:hypothetical protein